ncbi:fibronectin type III domain-containing protein [Candidatus Chlorohelix sp.]|uniref:fibronectin type III domain-containing protein n=1 Tax=Candidatus Chlorohelix sp. TaxID=3139201 RepID=UPI003032B573
MVRTESPRLPRRIFLIGGLALLLIAFIAFFNISTQTNAAVSWSAPLIAPTNTLKAVGNGPQTLIDPIRHNVVVIGAYCCGNPTQGESATATGGVFFFSSHDTYNSYVTVTSWAYNGVPYTNFSGAFDRNGYLHIVYTTSNMKKTINGTMYYVRYSWNGSSYAEVSRTQIMNNVCGSFDCQYVSLTSSLYPTGPDKLYLAYNIRDLVDAYWRIDVTETSGSSPNYTWGSTPTNAGVSTTKYSFRYPSMVVDKDGSLFLAYQCGLDWGPMTNYKCIKVMDRNPNGVWGPVYSYNLDHSAQWPAVAVDNKGNGYVFSGYNCLSMIKYTASVGWSGAAGDNVVNTNSPTKSCVTGSLAGTNPPYYNNNIIKAFSAVGTGDGSIYIAFPVLIRGMYYAYTTDGGATFGPDPNNPTAADTNASGCVAFDGGYCVFDASIAWDNNTLVIGGKKTYNQATADFKLSILRATGGGYYDAAPSNLTFSKTATSLTLSWQNNSPHATAFKVERRPYPAAGGSWATISSNAANPFIDSGLTEATGYEYRVTAMGTPLGNLLSPTVHDFTVLLPPTLLQSTTSTTTSIVLGWTAGSAANTGFSVERASLTATSTFTVKGTPGTNSYTDATISPAGEYGFFYRVRAYKTVPGSTEGTIYSDYSNLLYSETAPNAPTGVTATPNGSTSEKIEWTDTSTFEDGYNIIIGASTYTVGPVSGTGSKGSYIVNGLTPNTTYNNVKVQAFSAGKGVGETPTSFTTALAPPTAVNLTSVTGSTLTVNWTAPSGTPTSYAVERLQLGVDSSWTQVGTPTPPPNSFDDTGLTAGKIYLYRVKAINAGTSDPSAEAGVLTTGGTERPVTDATTLTDALTNAVSGDIIKITGNVTVSGALPDVPPGVTIIGSCSTNGPAIEITGATGSVNGLNLFGATLYGIYIHGFTSGKEIITHSGRNVMNCVKVGQ